ncbi:WYL domain-containing protein [Streptomyces sp. NPDC004610]|uniref:WYL domain-containing protein n=1 Tax=unclassified Streptomyces TaxID=2593676 RepID=UPI0033A15E1E
MRHTKNETTIQTLTRLITAADRQHPVSITAMKEEKDETGKKTGRLVKTTRTIEVYDFYVSHAGHILIKAMDRESGERREFRLDRLLSYSIHRTRYLVPRPAAEEARRPAHGLATVIVLYPVDCPIAARVALLADALAA